LGFHENSCSFHSLSLNFISFTCNGKNSGHCLLLEKFVLASEFISYYTLHACNQLIFSNWSFVIRLNNLVFGHLESQQVITLSMKLCYEIFICWVYWPWIISRWLWQVVQKLRDKHFDHCPIYFVIMQVVTRCPMSNLETMHLHFSILYLDI
jgi:hypothetical protein